MNGTLDRWYVSGPLGVGTTFDETLDTHSKTYINSPTSLGSMFRHEGWETLNLLDSRVAGIGQGPNLNLWGLNGAKKAVRLGTISARFSATADAGSSSYLSFHTKPANGDVREVLRIDGDGNINMVTSSFNTLTVGSGANGVIRVRHIDGKNWQNDNNDGLYLNWSTGQPVTVGSPGIAANLAVNGSLTVTGNVGIGTGAPQDRLHVANGDLRLDGGRTIRATGRMHITGEELLYVLNKSGMIVSSAWGGTGDLTVERNLSVSGDMRVARIGVFNQPPTPRTPGWGGGIHTWDIEVEGTGWSRNGWQSGNRDMAENFASEVALEPGEVVSFDPDGDGVLRAATANDTLVCGVISTAPGVLLNSDPDAPDRDGRVPVALCGRVPCKVVDENGPIRRGDLLTSSSIPGHAMRAEPILVDGEPVYRSGTIVGKALAAHAAGTGVIDIFVVPN